jgi:hypothetical protein
MAISPTATSPTDPLRIDAMTPPPTLTQDPMAARRASARRTALVFAVIAAAVYAGFMLLNVVAK